MTYRSGFRLMSVAGLLAAILAAGQPGPAVATPVSAGAGDIWAVDLSTIDGDDVNVVYRDGALRLADLTVTGDRRQSAHRTAVVEGVLVPATYPLTGWARQLRAQVEADAGHGSVEIEVRGVQTNGWSDWHRIPADGMAFSREVSSVQVRIRLTLPIPRDGATGDIEAPRVTAVTLTAVPGD